MSLEQRTLIYNTITISDIEIVFDEEFCKGIECENILNVCKSWNTIYV